MILDEDHCQLRKGRTHHLMALFRNLALSLLRLNDHDNIPVHYTLSPLIPTEHFNSATVLSENDNALGEVLLGLT